MAFRRQDDEEEDSDHHLPPPHTPHPIREPALGRPMLSPSSSLLISPRGAGGGTRNGMGSLNPHPTSSREPAPITVSSAGAIHYRECLRNDAASLGSHILDSCCKFMPSSDDAFKCAACACHRSFHRIDGDLPSSSSLHHLHDSSSMEEPPLLLPPLHPTTTTTRRCNPRDLQATNKKIWIRSLGELVKDKLAFIQNYRWSFLDEVFRHQSSCN